MTVSIRNQLLEQIKTAIETGGQSGKAYIVLQSDTTQAISTDQANPTILNNWVVVASNGMSLQGESIRNDTGRTLDFLHGTIGFHPQVIGGGGTREIVINSETSPDEITYTMTNQVRPISTTNNAETFNTKESYLSDFTPGEYVRFIAFVNGGALSIAQSSTTMRNLAQTGPAAIWILHEA